MFVGIRLAVIVEWCNRVFGLVRLSALTRSSHGLSGYFSPAPTFSFFGLSPILLTPAAT